MNIRSLHVPITAAALAVLLTACGGGGGGGTEGKAVSASPNAPGSSSTAGSTGTAANGTSETLDGGTNANGNTVHPGCAHRYRPPHNARWPPFRMKAFAATCC